MPSATSNLLSGNAFNLDLSKILPFGEELTPILHGSNESLFFSVLKWKSVSKEKTLQFRTRP